MNFSLGKQFPIVSPEETEVHIFDSIQILNNYIPHPDMIVAIKLADLFDEIESRIASLDLLEKGPYIPKYYGKLRKEAYSEFKKVINDYPAPKRRIYINQFYQNLDRKCQDSFERHFNLKEMYSKRISNPQLQQIFLFRNDNHHEISSEDNATKLLTKDMRSLIIDWYILIEKTVDFFLKCQLYQIKEGSIYRELFLRIKKQEENKEESWLRKLISNWKTHTNQGCYSEFVSQKEEMGYADGMDSWDLFILVTLTTCGETFAKLFNELKQDEQNKELLTRIKGILLLAKQTLGSLLQDLTHQFEKCLLNSSKKELYILESLIDEFVNFKEFLSMFENKPVKTYSVLSQENNWLEFVKIKRSLSESQKKKNYNL